MAAAAAAAAALEYMEVEEEEEEACIAGIVGDICLRTEVRIDSSIWPGEGGKFNLKVHEPVVTYRGF